MMKKFTFFLVLMFSASWVFSQVQTVKIPDAKVTVTNEQIKAWGEASQQNAERSLIVLNFEGLGNSQSILNYYDGGLSGGGFGPGPSYGVQFVGNTLSIIDSDAGGGGNIANEPSPSTVMFFLTGSATIMNVPAGFTTGFSFYYSVNTSAGSVAVYDGLNGTGSLLASMTLPINFNIDCTGDPNGAYCHWDPIGVPFSGIAKSVVFAGVANFCAFDDVTFGSATPGAVPVSNWALFIGIGLILIAAVVRFRRIL